MKFKLGKILITSAVKEKISMRDIFIGLGKHSLGDWGNICEEDKTCNDEAVKNKKRIISQFESENNEKYWIITEYDRSYTTVLLPEEY